MNNSEKEYYLQLLVWYSLKLKFPVAEMRDQEFSFHGRISLLESLFFVPISTTIKQTAGPEKYREHGSNAPRKDPYCQEGRPNLEEKWHFHGLRMLFTVVFHSILAGSKPQCCRRSQEAKLLFRPWQTVSLKYW
jgi:hypothetical protein